METGRTDNSVAGGLIVRVPSGRAEVLGSGKPRSSLLLRWLCSSAFNSLAVLVCLVAKPWSLGNVISMPILRSWEQTPPASLRRCIWERCYLHLLVFRTMLRGRQVEIPTLFRVEKHVWSVFNAFRVCRWQCTFRHEGSKLLHDCRHPVPIFKWKQHAHLQGHRNLAVVQRLVPWRV